MRFIATTLERRTDAVIIAAALSAGTWLGAAPIPRRLPVQLALMALTALALSGAAKVRVPRWIFLALAGGFALSCTLIGLYFLALVTTLLTLVVLPAIYLLWRRFSQRNGLVVAKAGSMPCSNSGMRGRCGSSGSPPRARRVASRR